MLLNNYPVVYDTKIPPIQFFNQSIKQHTFIANTTVLIIINEKIAYSNGGDVTNHQIFN
jgi:hypothetical protein